jgi:hypothetical protein
VKRKVILKRRPRVKVLQKKLEAIDRERAMLASIAPKPEELVPQPESHLALDFEFWRSYRLRAGLEEESNCRNLRPRDTLERMLTQQMSVCHRRAMDFISIEGRDEEIAINRAIRLMRIFAIQVEALKSWRSNGTQTVKVEHVQVNAGGQAIVGSVTALSEGRGGVKKISEGLSVRKRFGPKTPEGLERCTRASWKHGRRSQVAALEAAELRTFLRNCRETIAKVQEHRIATPASPPEAAPIKAFKATNYEDCPRGKR